MALATLNGSPGRPPSYNPNDAASNAEQGLTPTSPAAVVVRNAKNGLTWTTELISTYSNRGAFYVDDLTKAEMDRDDCIAQCFTIFKGLVLNQEPRVLDSHRLKKKRSEYSPSDPELKDYLNSRMVSDFLAYCFHGADGGMWQYDYQLLDAAKRGLMVAVIVCKPEKYTADGRNQTKWVLDYLQILRKGEYRPYFNKANRLIGFQVYDQTYLDAGGKKQPLIWGLDKFVVAIFRPEWGSIWGSDLYGPAYLPYMLKNKGWEQYYAAIEQVGTPTAYHTVGENLTGTVVLKDEDGNKLYWADEAHSELSSTVTDYGEAKVPPGEAQHYAVRNGIGNGKVVYISPGGTLSYLQAQDSQTIPNFIEEAQIAIHRAMLGTDKFAMRGTHESSGSSDAGERITSLPASEGKYMLECCRWQLARTLTKWNYGPDFLKYRPHVDFGSGLASDIPEWLNSLSSLSSTRRITDHQLQSALTNRCGFEQATAEELEEMQPELGVEATGARPDDSPGSGSKNT